MTRTTPLEEVLLAGELDVPRTIALLDHAVRNNAVPGLSLLERCLTHPNAELRAAAYRSLSSAKSLQALRTLVTGLNDPNDDVVAAAAESALDGEDAGPQALVAFHPHANARRTAARLTSKVDLLYLLLADSGSRGDAIERLQEHRPIARNDVQSAIVGRLITDGTLPPRDAALLFRNDPDSAGLLAMTIAKDAINLARGEPDVVYERPREYVQLLVPHPAPSPFVTLIEWLDATPGAWLAMLAHRNDVLSQESEQARTTFLIWQSITVHSARLHASLSTWNPEALIVESTFLPWLLLADEIPLETRRDALRRAAGITGQKPMATVFDWYGDFVTACLKHPIAQKDSGVSDLRVAYALVDVLAGGWPLKMLESRLGRSAIVRAAPENAAGLAWMIGATPIRRTDHLVALQWLEAIASEHAAAFVDITRTLQLAYWNDIPDHANERLLDRLLAALAASDAPSSLWSTWASAITGAGPSVSAVLESRGYRVVRPETTLFPHTLSSEQRAEAKRLGVPALLEHVPSGIVLVLIPGGEFVMGGSDLDPDAYPREKPAQLMRVDTFYLGVSPVTQKQWISFELPMRDQPNVPVRGVNWKTATEFLAKLNCGMRLPHESEWERAARAGTTTRYWWGDAFRRGMVNCQEELAKAHATPTGAFPPNPWGLIDILGNVWEWCDEWFHDPAFHTGKRWRVLRGGAWFHERWNTRVSERYWGEPEGHDPTGVWGVRAAADLSICFDAPP